MAPSNKNSLFFRLLCNTVGIYGKEREYLGFQEDKIRFHLFFIYIFLHTVPLCKTGVMHRHKRMAALKDS